MTQEEKQLLLKDLCARLPYEVCVHHPDFEQVFCLEEISPTSGYWRFSLASDRRRTLGFEFFRDEMKPYLRPMSSMTEEEYEDLCNSCTWLWFKNDLRTVTHGDYKCYDWLNVHHFDYRGLIEKGLAFEAPEGMYETK